MQRFFQVLFWSIIAAAFIGPGTVTTAASAGANHGFSLLWALLFSTLACLVLQEASARVTVISGRNLGQAIRERFHAGAAGILVLLLVLGAIILGCAAYEAGNILGSVAGAGIGTGLPKEVLTIAIGAAAALLLYFGTTKTVARIMGVIVAFMGVAFLVTAFLIKPPFGALLKGTLVPSLPEGSSLLVLGLIGTTVVPYNLFLGSGIAAGQKLGELRFGLSVAILLGGIISMGILVVGTAVAGSFDFRSISTALSGRLGGWAGMLLALGLFAAGFSSAITAPLAAAITAKSLFCAGDDGRWRERSWRYRSVWLGVLLVGVFFGLTGVRPIPAIIVAQALNGILLPFVAIFLFLVVNDSALMGERGINHMFLNICMGVVVVVAVVLGVTNVTRAVTTALEVAMPGDKPLAAVSAAVALILVAPITRAALKRR